MSQVPIKNLGKTVMHVNNVLIPPGEVKVFDEADLPPHLQPAREPAPLPTEPDDPLLELLDKTVAEIVAAVEERDESGRPVLSDDELIRLAEAEANGKSRSTLQKPLEEERMRRADEAEKREALAVFAESLKDMGDEQLAELKKTHQEDPEKVRAIEWQELANEIDAAVEKEDRDTLKSLRELYAGYLDEVAAIDAALAKLDGGADQ